MAEPILYPRFVRNRLEEALEDTPVVLVHGPRQCGKTTLARMVGDAAGNEYITFDDYDYDEDPDLISEDQIDELASFFGEAENLFLDDRLENALKVYQALFGLIEAFRELADLSLADAVDIREARARYCRCIFETVKESEKLHVFAAAMDIDWVSPYEANQNEYNEDYPLLQDVIDASVDEMKHLDTFLPAWRKTGTLPWLCKSKICLFQHVCS